MGSDRITVTNCAEPDESSNYVCISVYIYNINNIYSILIYINYIRTTSIIYYRIMNYQSLRSAPAKVDRGTRPQGFTPVVQIESVPKFHLQCLCKRQLMGLPGIFPICSYKSAINPQLNKQLQYLMLRSRLGHCFCITSLATDAWFRWRLSCVVPSSDFAAWRLAPVADSLNDGNRKLRHRLPGFPLEFQFWNNLFTQALDVLAPTYRQSERNREMVCRIDSSGSSTFCACTQWIGLVTGQNRIALCTVWAASLGTKRTA